MTAAMAPEAAWAADCEVRPTPFGSHSSGRRTSRSASAPRRVGRVGPVRHESEGFACIALSGRHALRERFDHPRELGRRFSAAGGGGISGGDGGGGGGNDGSGGEGGGYGCGGGDQVMCGKCEECVRCGTRAALAVGGQKRKTSHVMLIT
eukprot:6194794-Pleurochrysis_carterae.AAC.2